MLNATTGSAYGSGLPVAGYVIGLVLATGVQSVMPDVVAKNSNNWIGPTFVNLIAEDSAAYLRTWSAVAPGQLGQLSVITLSLVEQKILHALDQLDSGEYLVVPDGLTAEDDFFAWLENAV